MSDKKHELNNLFHILFCNRTHAYKMEELADRQEKTCYYELEESLDNCMEQPDHQRIELILFGVMNELEFKSLEDLSFYFDELLDVCRQLNKLIYQRPGIEKYLIKWLHLTTSSSST